MEIRPTLLYIDVRLVTPPLSHGAYVIDPRSSSLEGNNAVSPFLPAFFAEFGSPVSVRVRERCEHGGSHSWSGCEGALDGMVYRTLKLLDVRTRDGVFEVHGTSIFRKRPLPRIYF